MSYAINPTATGWRAINSIADLMEGEVFSAEQPVLAPPPAPILPISPRQIRMALTRAGLRQAVETAVAAGDQDLKDWWEFSTTFERTNAQVTAMAHALSVSEGSLDDLWKLGATL